MLKNYGSYKISLDIMNNQPLLIRITYLLLFFILLFFILIEARGFLYPLALGIFFAYLLYPIANFLEKKGLHRILANLLTIFLGLTTLAGLLIFLYSQLRVFIDDFPAMRSQAVSNLIAFENFIESKFGVATTVQHSWIRESVQNMFQAGGDFFNTFFAATTGTLVTFGLLPVYIFFLLFYRNKFKVFLLKLIPDERHDKVEIIITKISYVVNRYMSGIFIVVLILCFLNSIGLIIVGIKYAVLLGVISAIFNLIPYFGTLIGGSIPLLMALLTEDSPKYAVGVIILFIILQFTENNILTPNITGGNVNINPFITILSIIVGGMVWGIPGMFMVVPIIGIIKIICDHIESLEPYAYLLGTQGSEKHAITIKMIKNYFSRKLSK
jgi:predicted PurR-regulated permease PerM